MRHLIAGMLMMGYATAALFFLRFWRSTNDTLFAAFAIAFALLALQRVLLAAYAGPDAPIWPYVVRLVAFVVILMAIAGKNIVPGRQDQ